jgi:SWI/SNF-related matrix-associated actin-dependent regulator 1 of chromatin subfamily A
LSKIDGTPTDAPADAALVGALVVALADAAVVGAAVVAPPVVAAEAAADAEAGADAAADPAWVGAAERAGVAPAGEACEPLPQAAAASARSVPASTIVRACVIAVGLIGSRRSPGVSSHQRGAEPPPVPARVAPARQRGCSPASGVHDAARAHATLEEPES